MSLSFTGLERLEGGQQGIEGFFGGKPPTSASSPRKIKVDSGIPVVKRSRSTSPLTRDVKPDSLASASHPTVAKRPRLPTLHAGPSRKTGLESFLSGTSTKKNGEPSSSIPTSTRVSPLVVDEEDEAIEIIEVNSPKGVNSESGQWTCPKCEYRTTGVNQSENQGQKQEHEDFHFAQSLQDAGSSPVRSRDASGIGTSSNGGMTKKKKIKKAEGIKAFFTPKAAKKEER
jgi:DNA polymerase eta